MEKTVYGILTVSDSCHAGMAQDRSGPALKQEILKTEPNAVILEKIVPDSQNSIKTQLIEWSQSCNVIFTTGGTGFAPRDVTPEATKSVIEREAPGLAYAMISGSLNITKMAMLSRPVCGIRGRCLIVNFPGSPKAAVECYGFIKSSIPHAIALLSGESTAVKEIHQKMQAGCGHVCSHSKVKTDKPAFRNRESPYPMKEIDEALEIIYAFCVPTAETEQVKIEDSLGRVLAEDVYSKEPLPPFEASTKDGYAVKASDGIGFRMVRNAVVAGDAPDVTPLKNGEAIRISTGAPVPSGSDAVVQVEDTVLVEATPDGKMEIKIEVKTLPVVGQDIRPVGSDIPINSLVLNREDCITPGHVGVLATVGKAEVLVYKRPTVGIISTGNELQTHEEELRPGRIRDSNKLTLLNLLRQYDIGANDCGIVRDKPDELKTALEKAFLQNDVVITTGGVSMGEHDFVKQVLKDDFNATIHFGRVNVKPGKPTTFATCTYSGRTKIIFGLPGNPVSATVTSSVFTIPALRYLEHKYPPALPKIKVRLGQDITLDPRPEYVRVHLRSEPDSHLFTAYTTGNQISSRLNSFVGASALAILPGRNTGGYGGVCPKGEIVNAHLIDVFAIDKNC